MAMLVYRSVLWRCFCHNKSHPIRSLDRHGVKISDSENRKTKRKKRPTEIHAVCVTAFIQKMLACVDMMWPWIRFGFRVFCCSLVNVNSQMLHVGNIYLHFPLNVAIFHLSCRQIIHTWSIWDLFWFWKKRWCAPRGSQQQKPFKDQITDLLWLSCWRKNPSDGRKGSF